MMVAAKSNHEYLISADVIVERDCLSLLGIISSCQTADIAMLSWIGYIK